MNTGASPNISNARHLLRNDVLYISGFALAYFLAHWISFLFPDSQRVLMAVWPAGGIGIAALLMSPQRLWPAMLAALYAVGIIADLLAGRLFVNCLGFMAGNVLESFGSAWVITRLSGPHVTFNRVREVAALVVAATLVNACTALVGAGTATLTSGSPFWHFWRTWWIADGLGILLVAPLIVAWSSRGTAFARVKSVRTAEWLTFFAVWILLATVAFRILTMFLSTEAPYIFVALVAWPALRFGQRSVTAALVVLAAIMLSAAPAGSGMNVPGGGSWHESILYLQMYLTFVSVAGLFLTASYAEAQQAITSLRESEARYRLMADNMADVIWVLDPALQRFTYVSPSVFKLRGYTPEEVMAQPLAQALTPESAKLVGGLFATLVQRSLSNDAVPGPAVNEIYQPCKDGSIVCTEVTTTHLVDKQKHIKIVGVSRDITARKKAEAAHRESEELFRSVFEQHSAAKLLIDPDSGSIIDANTAAAEFYGWTREQLKKMSIQDINVLSPREVELEMDKAKSAQRIHFEFCHRLANGSIKDVEVFSSKIEIQGKDILHSIIHDITERKQAETALRDSEANYRSVVEEASDGIFIADETGRYTDANPRALAMTGYSREEILGLTMKDLLQPEDVSVMPVRFEELKTRGELLSERRIRRKDGSMFYAEISAKRLGDGRLQGIARDITERMVAEKTIRESEEKYRTLFNNAEIGMFRTKADGSATIDFNDKYLEIYGRTRREMQGTPPANFWADPAERAEMVHCLNTEGFVANFPCRMLNKQGTVRYCLTSVRLYKDEGIMEGSIIDVTDLTLAQQQVADALSLNRTILNSSPVGIAVYRASGECVSANRSSAAMLGATPEQMLARNFRQLENWKREGLLEISDTVLTKGKPLSKETHVTSVYGKEVWLNASFATFMANGAKHLLILTEDISERRKTETALQNAQKLDSLGVLAGGIAHDFNNLLGGIFGYLDLAQSESLPEKSSKYLSKAIATIDRARGLTRQLLTFAKGGAPELKTQPMQQILKDTTQFALSGSNVSSTFDIPNDLWPCPVDKNQISQVFDNIVINAQQAMPLGGTLVVAAKNMRVGENEHPPLREGEYVRISFTDTGVGIPADILPRIFDPFFTTKTKGHGLGLATCFSIAKRHGGAIEVASEPGKGSSFTVLLPASDAEVFKETKPVAVKHAGSGAILVMDDEEVVRDTAAAMIEKLGYTVECVANGTDALLLVSRREESGTPFRAAIFDLTIPGGLGGKETAAELRRLGRTLPVFVASGYGEDPVMAKPQEFGFTASLQKPFTKAELARMLEKYLGSKG